MNFELELLPDTFAICRLDPGAAIPDWAQGSFVSATRTEDELTIICLEPHVPERVEHEVGWRCLRLVGSFDLSEVGVLARLAAPLAAADISLFVVGTFDTDYLFVRRASLTSALSALKKARHAVRLP